MELTKIERLSLINQYLILEKLYPEEQEHYSELRQALENGYTLHYSWCFDFLSDDMPIDECKKVLDILDLYRSITYSDMDLKNVEITKHHYFKFSGFDGNNEPEYMGYTDFFIKKLGRFDELLYDNPNRSFNSHCPMLPKYERMLNVWKHEINKNYQLSSDQILLLLEA